MMFVNLELIEDEYKRLKEQYGAILQKLRVERRVNSQNGLVLDGHTGQSLDAALARMAISLDRFNRCLVASHNSGIGTFYTSIRQTIQETIVIPREIEEQLQRAQREISEQRTQVQRNSENLEILFERVNALEDRFIPGLADAKRELETKDRQLKEMESRLVHRERQIWTAVTSVIVGTVGCVIAWGFSARKK